MRSVYKKTILNILSAMNQILLAWFLCSAFFGQTLLNQVTKDPDKPGRKSKVLVKKLLLGFAIIEWYFLKYLQLPLAVKSILSRKVTIVVSGF